MRGEGGVDGGGGVCLYSACKHQIHFVSLTGGRVTGGEAGSLQHRGQ